MYNAVWDGYKMVDEWLIFGEPATILLLFFLAISLHGIHCEEEI